MADETPNYTMRKVQVKEPGRPPEFLYFGPGFVAIDDLGGSARVEAQGYTEEELTAAFTEGRSPVPVSRHSEPLGGQAYQDFKAANPDFVQMLVKISWEVLETPKNIGNAPATGESDTRTNFFDGAVKTFGPGADAPAS